MTEDTGKIGTLAAAAEVGMRAAKRIEAIEAELRTLAEIEDELVRWGRRYRARDWQAVLDAAAARRKA